MFFPNHQGLFDVLAIIQVCPVPFSVVAKKELSDVPFLKQVFALHEGIQHGQRRYQTVYAGDPESYKRSKAGKKLSDIRRGNQK